MIYVYALADRDLPRFRLAGHAIGFEAIAGIHVAFERLPQAPEMSEDALRVQHAIVTRIAQDGDAVLPARFGSFLDEPELRRVLELRRDVIREALDLVRGRVQMTTRILGRPAALRPEARASASAGGVGTRYLQARRAAAVDVSPALLESITMAVSDIASAVRVERGEGQILAKMDHLVARGQDGRFREALAPVSRALEGGTLVVTGPWPAFAFAPALWS